MEKNARVSVKEHCDLTCQRVKYVTTEGAGSLPHAPNFRSYVTIGERSFPEGKGRRIKLAEEEAARLAMNVLKCK